MHKVPQIFDNKSLKIDYTNEFVLNFQGLLIKTLQERLQLFSRKFPIQVFHRIGSSSQAQFGNLKSIIATDLELLPFKNQSIDLALSPGPLTITNDIPGVLKQWYAALKPGGVFMASFLGEDSLKELKECFLSTEEALKLPHSLRFFPTVATKDAGMLAQRAGFHLPTADKTRHTFCVRNFKELLKILKATGGNILHDKSSQPLSRQFLQLAEENYQSKYASQNGLNVTVDIVCMTGWAIERYADERIQQHKQKTLGYL